jgi:hypothetical protein
MTERYSGFRVYRAAKRNRYHVRLNDLDVEVDSWQLTEMIREITNALAGFVVNRDENGEAV